MPKGRPPKPLAQLKYEGGYNKERHANRGDELQGNIVNTIDTPEGLSPLAGELFQHFITPLCSRGLVFVQDLSILIPAAYILENIIWAKNEMATASNRQERMNLISNMNKSIKEFASIAYKFYVSPVERTRAVIEASSGTPLMSLAERMKNAKKES